MALGGVRVGVISVVRDILGSSAKAKSSLLFGVSRLSFYLDGDCLLLISSITWSATTVFWRYFEGIASLSFSGDVLRLGTLMMYLFRFFCFETGLTLFLLLLIVSDLAISVPTFARN